HQRVRGLIVHASTVSGEIHDRSMRTRSVTSDKGQPALALRRRGISRTGDERIAWRQNALAALRGRWPADGVGPGLVAVGYGRGVGLLELHPQVLAQLVQAGVGPPVV